MLCEIKRSSAPTVSRGFYEAASDVKATRRLVVAPVPNRYPGRDGVEVMPLIDAVRLLGEWVKSFT